MNLIRGWERRFSPGVVGGLRLSTAKTFRTIGEEDGLGDRREGEIRAALPSSIELQSDGPITVPMTVSLQTDPDEAPMVAENLVPGERREVEQHAKVGDSQLISPFLFCLSREPTSQADWKGLRASLPDRYDTYTITTDLNSLSFEIEWGIKRWLSLHEISEHKLFKYRGWVTYPFNDIPPSVSPKEALNQIRSRWFQKRRKYGAQQEFRLAWEVTSPQWEHFPDQIDIELSRTGLGLFKPWSPPTV